jgi:hypothetical protein
MLTQKGRNDYLRLFFIFFFTYQYQNTHHMATATGKTRCVLCNKEKTTLRCAGCLKEFCFNHWEPHRQELNKQFDEIEINRDLFRQSLTEQTEEPYNHILIKQINKWERNSIKIIEETAEEVRQVVLKNTNEYTHQLEMKLKELTNQLRECRHENDFNEINLRQFQEELDKLTKELTKPSNISIRQDSTPFISKISVEISSNVVNLKIFCYSFLH